MANNNLETYLEAILDKIADGTETNIPRPSWNIEKYLAAIYEALSSGGGGGGGGSTGGGVLVVHDVNGTLDKTWTEIENAMTNYGAVLVETNNGNLIAVYVFIRADGEEYSVTTSAEDTYVADSASGYPSLVN